MNSSYQEIFQITKGTSLAKNIVRENVLEEDEDMLSDNYVAGEEKNEEEKIDKHHHPYQSAIQVPSHTKDKLNRKKFDFLYHRTAFRYMGDFYKSTFAHIANTKKISKKLTKLTAIFTQKVFGQVIQVLPNGNMQIDFNKELITLIHCHRHNNSSLIENTTFSSKDSAEDLSFSELDFSIVRDVMYKYSKQAEERFFTVPELCFFYIWFASNQKALEKVRNKTESKGSEYSFRIMKEIQDLQQRAYNSLASFQNDKAKVYFQIVSNGLKANKQ